MNIKQFTKKPIVINAVCLSTENILDIATWCGGRPLYGLKSVLVISTLEGDMRADLGDWSIEGLAGEYYPCKPDIFHKSYTEVE